MSHIAKVELEIRDLDALEAAAKRCGLELARGQTTYRWYGGQHSPCDHTIRIPDSENKHRNAYEVGVIKRTNGRPGYELNWDPFMGGYGLTDLLGKGCSNLKREYAAIVATRSAQSQGFRVQEQKLVNGGVRLVLSK